MKVVMNLYGLLSAGLKQNYKREFDIFNELETERKALRSVGKRDGLIHFYQSFTAVVPVAFLDMVAAKYGALFLRTNFPPAEGACVM